jgi:hypothetical protein
VKKELSGGEFWTDGYDVAKVGERASWVLWKDTLVDTKKTHYPLILLVKMVEMRYKDLPDFGIEPIVFLQI